MRTLVLLLFLLTPGLALSAGGLFGGGSQGDFLPVDEAFALAVSPQENGATLLHWRIAPGYYLYQQRLRFDGLPPERQPPLPEGEPYSDEFFGDSQIYRDSLELLIPPGVENNVRLGWQGCADAGLCYPPQTREVSLSGDAGNSSVASAQAEDQALVSGLENQALVWSLLVFFGLGLLLAFTPCSLPMLPILAGIVVGSGATLRRGFALAAIYVVSMALVYAGLGVLAALLGANLQAALQQPWLLTSFAVLFVLLALPMFGLFELQLPAALRDRLERAGRQQRVGSLAGAGALGVLSGLLVGPCMTAPLAAALLFIAQSGSALQGGLVLFALGLGIGTPLLLLVTVGQRFVPKPGAWMDRVKVLFGFLFLAAALFVARPLLADWLWLGLWGALLVVLATALLHVAQAVQRQRVLCQASGVLLGLWGAAMLLGAAGGADDPRRPLAIYAGGVATAATVESYSLGFSDPSVLDRELAAAKAQGQWVLIDYYADWCVSCKVMEKEVFGNAEVQASLDGVRVLRPDVTRSDTASRKLLDRYQVLGPPTLLWIGPDGVERRERRITGEVGAGDFLQNWNQTRERG
ncbi:thiol:disulfide interchange protein [Stutzerimonas frequens]|uniref:Thiol:disulfide interchange protein DsbD n=1 Tax=Stutzerimonas frequens TaxID=2968969 RepID=A0ABX6XT93_9GAMM|nr:protein-disulfide reductase DsbD [Stutzerimonas frequens]MCQ4303165.1 protein-disulfide reductase DsbD [Stutzerimonas frequens]PNF50775.1 thiol:disulfide interchange protein [Stutzerimonas frequens]QPT17266.1 protein-disulfide reductase DsbD [Stutzerimonas frequens]